MSKNPNIFCASFKSISDFSFWLNKALSKSERASLTDPSDIFTINFRASSFIFPFSLSFTSLINLNKLEELTLAKSNL